MVEYTTNYTTGALKMTIEKVNAFIEKNNLNELVELSDTGVFTVPEDLYKEVVLDASGITEEQLKKKIRLEGELLTGVVSVAGTKAATIFKDDANLSEVGLSYNYGNTSHTASVVFNRDSKDHVFVEVNNKVETADMKRVFTQINGLFDDLNS